MNSLSRLLIASVVIVMLYAIGLRLIKPPFFPLKEINIQVINGTGSSNMELQRITHEQIEHIARNEIKGNFLSMNLVDVRDAFIRLPWIREAKVKREWPHGLNVTVEEHRALAHWGSHALVNTYGEVFRVSIDEKLPVFIGPKEDSAQEVAQQYQRFSRILAPIQQDIAEINLSPRHAWRIQLDTGTVLELGRNEIEIRLARYVSVYNHSIARLNQQEPLAYVDLRYPDGFAVRMPEVTPHVPRESGGRKAT
ncbi:MAG: cell division protein FtsQ/DivIB [Pseudomonadota bacterium]